MSVNIIKEGKKLLISFKYDAEKVNSIKTIYNHRWHPDKKVWSIPYSIVNIDRVRYLFSGEEINIDFNDNSNLSKIALNKNIRTIRQV